MAGYHVIATIRALHRPCGARDWPQWGQRVAQRLVIHCCCCTAVTIADTAAVFDARMDACLGQSYDTTGMATRDSVTSPNKNHHIPIFLARIGFRSEHCGFGRDWTWTFHCFSIGYLRAGVLLLLHFADHSVDQLANEHIHDTRSRLCSGLRLGQKNLFVTFATIPTPSRVRWHGVLLYLSLLGKSLNCL